MEDELAALVEKRSALEKELEREASVESEKAKIAELEGKIREREKELHPARFEHFRKSMAELKKEWDKYKLKQTGLHL